MEPDWREYEARKAEIRGLELTPEEYDAAHRRICDELGV